MEFSKIPWNFYFLFQMKNSMEFLKIPWNVHFCSERQYMRPEESENVSDNLGMTQLLDHHCRTILKKLEKNKI
eukprot:UN07834